MEKLQQGVLIFCAACIVSGLLERIVSMRRRFPVIKLVCALYIVSAVFIPMQNIRAQDLTAEIPAPPRTAPVPDTQQLALEAAEKSLSDTVAQALAAQGIECRAVQVHLDRQAEEAAVTGVTVTVPANANVDGAQEAVARALGAGVSVDVQWEGI